MSALEVNRDDINIPEHFDPHACIRGRLGSGLHEIIDVLNAHLDASANPRAVDLDGAIGGDPWRLSAQLIQAASELRSTEKKEYGLALEVLDEGLRWPNTQVKGTHYVEVALAALVSDDADIAYGSVALDERRMTASAGLAVDLDEAKVRTGNHPSPMVRHIVCWMGNVTPIHAEARRRQVGSVYETEFRALFQKYLDSLRGFASAQEHVPGATWSTQRPVLSRYDDELKKLHELLSDFGEQEWADQIAEVYPSLRPEPHQEEEHPEPVEERTEQAPYQHSRFLRLFRNVLHRWL